jgi:AcrR family transcriptional regulator
VRAKPASQQRSQDKRDRILTAMRALLEVRPFAEIGVSDLAREAQVPAATIYQRFSNTDATASVLLELYYREVEAWARAPQRRRPQAATPFEALMNVAAEAFDQVAALGRLMRPAYLYSRQHPDRVGPEWQRLEQLALQGFRGFVAVHVPHLDAKAQQDAARVLCQLYNLQLLGPLLHDTPAQWQSAARRRRFAGDLATLAWRYLEGLR